MTRSATSGAGARIDATIEAARAKLPGALGKHPVILILGTTGSAKTTTIVRADTGAQLLAGDADSGVTAAPTHGVNVWLARDTILLEAGGAAAAEPGAWSRVLDHIVPPIDAAALKSGQQPPRAAVVCVSCEDIVNPPDDLAVGATADGLRSKLLDAAQRLGTSFPVYVVFTKLDRVAYFEEYVRTLSAEEARDIVGITLPARSGSDAATVTAAFNEVYRSIAARRLPLLSRAVGSDHTRAAYEFPREFRKLEPRIVQFLARLSKPDSGRAAPYLRGFYFTGVQPVMVETAPAPSGAAEPATSRSATQMLTRDELAGGVAMRKVPRWDFVARLLNDVILADRSAMDATRPSKRAAGAQRALAGAVAVLGLVLMAGFVVSFTNNRRLIANSAAVAGGLDQLGGGSPDAPTMQDLQVLEAARAQLDTLARYERNGAPLTMRMGLYSGSAAFRKLRGEYFDAFAELILGATQAFLMTTLEGLPDKPGPGDDYGRTYNLLKAYLITTSYPEKAADSGAARTLPDVLMRTWPPSQDLDPARAEIVRRQFATYVSELPFGHPYAADARADSTIVLRAQEFLKQSGTTAVIYQNMRSEAARARSRQFNRDVSGSAAVIKNAYEVPGEFTAAGWESMRRSLGNVDRYAQGETWVVGNQPVAALNQTETMMQLRAMYVADYKRHWRAYLDAATVVRPANLGDAAVKIRALSESGAPMLTMFAIAARETAVDSAIAADFQTVHVLTPPGDSTKVIGGKNEPYMKALIPLARAVSVAAGVPRGDNRIFEAVKAAADAQARIDELAQGFPLDPVVKRLLEAPIRQAEQLLRGG